MHFKGLDLNLLVILDALLEEQSVTKAAVRLNVSQPAISAALAKLRWHTGDELLQKAGRNFKLTSRAQTMVKPLQDILVQIEATMSMGSEFDPSVTSRSFKVSMTSYSANVLMPGLTKKIAPSYPRISCVVEDISPGSLSRVRHGDIDLCITFQQAKLLNPKESIEELTYARVFRDEWVIIAAVENEQVTEGMAYEDFCRLPYIETRLGGLPSLADRMLDQQPLRPQPIIYVPSFDHTVTNVINSSCVAVVPSLMIDEHRRPFVKMFKPPFSLPPIEEYLVWHSRNDAEPGHRWFRELLFEVASELQPSEISLQA